MMPAKQKCALAAALALGLAGAAAAADPPATARTAAPDAKPADARPADAKPAPSGPAVNLAQRWTAGDVQRYDFAFESSMASEVVSAPEGVERRAVRQRYAQEGRLSRRVISTDKDGAVVAIIIERLRLDTAPPTGSPASFDSAAPAAQDGDNALAPIVRAIVGRPVTVRLDPAGEVVSIEGNEDPPPQEGEDPATRVSVARAIMGDEVIRTLWRPLYGLPGAPAEARVGEAWNVETRTPGGPVGTMVLTTRLELKDAGEAARGTARLELTGGVLIVAAVGPMAIKPEIRAQSVSGEARWDRALGTLASWAFEQRLDTVRSRDDVSRTVDTVVRRRFTRVEAQPAQGRAGATDPAGADARK